MNKQFEAQFKNILRETEAVITDSHLVLTSGRHSSSYVNLRQLVKFPKHLATVAKEMERQIRIHDSQTIPIIPGEAVIVGPETLGRTFAELISVAGGFGFLAWADMHKDETGKLTASWNPKLGFEEIIHGNIIYIVDDLLTSGQNVLLVKDLVEKTGGFVEGVVVAARRDRTITADILDVPWLMPLDDIDLGQETYSPESCPLCKAGIHMKRRPGHGHEWEKRPENAGYPMCD